MKKTKDEKKNNIRKELHLDPLKGILGSLTNSIPTIKFAAIVSLEGLPILTALPPSIKEEQIAAITATILCMAEKAAVELRAGLLEQICMQCSNFRIEILLIGEEAVLMVGISKRVHLCSVLDKCREVSKTMAKII